MFVNLSRDGVCHYKHAVRRPHYDNVGRHNDHNYGCSLRVLLRSDDNKWNDNDHNYGRVRNYMQASMVPGRRLGCCPGLPVPLEMLLPRS